MKMDNNELLSAMLDGEVSPDELGSAIATLRTARDERDAVTVYQLIKDAISGVGVLDDGYTVRILARLEAHRAQSKSR
jgi:negative regulator of sigma E activity